MSERSEHAGRWEQLSVRMVLVDLTQSLLATLPAVVAVGLTGAGRGQIWPLIGLAAFGIIGAIADAWRWVFTRYRISPAHVELKSGVFVRRHRSIRRDRIRSVDVEARLRHRLGGLRVVKIGAGQQASDGESALELDALSAADARVLQDRLLDPRDTAIGDPVPSEVGPGRDEPLRVFARFDPRWVICNVFNAWAYLLALGLGWGGFWLLDSFGLDVSGFILGLLDWSAIGWAGTVAIVFFAVSVFGAAGLAVNYFTEYWNFELARVRGAEGTLLRTRHGLFTTREVGRDENRFRGAQISEPVLWRWMGVSDTTVITTGLSMWSMSQPAAILPRGPVAFARRVVTEVLGTEENLFEAPLARHPRAALWRRLWWATGLSAAMALPLVGLAVAGVVPVAVLWPAAVIWPVSLGAAVVAFRALGHAIRGPYLVTRSGLVSRATTVLQRTAVSTIVVRESLLQRRLGLCTVSAMTAAGYGGYDTPDIDAQDGLSFALEAAPGLLDPFVTVTGGEEPEGSAPGDPGRRRAGAAFG
ncbi:hypothetical protein BHE97_11575 [Aeromicrobium sp. PE09-221]|uniref:PH domain-containing protein n=1 Tax=Aeromicrobium sp. PE09-221 TaxID=1898043 RepID=UPI000B3ED189|nr:PH domain-containing protein [Aeromicrobium sp. PE09-221]OUZ09130.1 hypothetical protein BHE97_11575 [Aeromicrobium sp. PE09-221]